jgi:hypothetical protein
MFLKWHVSLLFLYFPTISARRNTYNGKTSMPSACFQPTVSASKRQQTYAIDWAAIRFSCILIYRVIKKSLCTWWLQYRKLQVMFKVSPASLQTFIDTPNCVLEDRVQNSTVHIPNVFCDGHLKLSNCVGIVIVRRTETFWSLCIC